MQLQTSGHTRTLDERIPSQLVDLLAIFAVLVSHYQLEIIATDGDMVIDEQTLALGMSQLLFGLVYYVRVAGRMANIATDIGFDNA